MNRSMAVSVEECLETANQRGALLLTVFISDFSIVLDEAICLVRNHERKKRSMKPLE